jgi:adenosine deaminase
VIDVFALPKAELHLHIEGTLEPDLMFALARRNDVTLPYGDVEAVKRAYVFSDLQSFLDIYYRSCAVLVTEQDFYDLTAAYLRRAHEQGVRRAEIFVDPQTHTARGIALTTVFTGIRRALDDATRELGMSSCVIPCFLRHLSNDDALRTFDELLAFRAEFDTVGLDSAEVGNPPAKFVTTFDRARAEGLRVVVHAGEEGPPEYIWQALDLLGAERIDHGEKSLDDSALVARLAREQVPLTVCPISNVKLRVVDTLADHRLRQLLEAGLCATVNSDDPAYFGAYVADNFEGTRAALGLSDDQVLALARNSFHGAFIGVDERARYLTEVAAQ